MNKLLEKAAQDPRLNRLADIGSDWGVGFTGIDGLEECRTLGKVEGLAHELAHCAVFGLAFRRGAVKKISARFRQYKSPLASDLAECRGLAVQELVRELLQWDWLPWFQVVKSAVDGMEHPSTGLTATERYIAKFKGQAVTKRRAAKVVAWLKTRMQEK